MRHYFRKFAAFLLVWLAVAKTGGLLVFADTFIDDCGSFFDTDATVYTGFGPVVTDVAQITGWAACPDRTALAMRTTQATATYRISGADTIEVNIYAENSTFASPVSAGDFRPGMRTSALPDDAVRLRCDRAGGAVYLYDQGAAYRCVYTPSGYRFVSDSTAPAAATLPYYGVNVAASRDGVHFTPLTVTLTAAQSQLMQTGSGVCYYETYQAVPMSGATYIRVQLTGCTTIPGVQSADSQTVALPLLATVRVNGNPLKVGPPDEGTGENPGEREPLGTVTYVREEPKKKSTFTVSKVSDAQIESKRGIIDTYNGDGSVASVVRITNETGGTVRYPAGSADLEAQTAVSGTFAVHHNLHEQFPADSGAQHGAAASAALFACGCACILLSRRRT